MGQAARGARGATGSDGARGTAASPASGSTSTGAPPAADGSGGSVWTARPWAARLLKAAIFVGPLVVSVVVSIVVAGVLPVPETLGGRVLWWGAVLASSSLVLVGGEALARRALPLVGLLRLSLLFPGPAPSRVDIASRSSRRELNRLSEAVRTHGLGADAEQAAVTLIRLIAALDAHDRRTRGHSERVRMYTDLLARHLHLDADEANKLRWAALLHDIGKLNVPTEILEKPGALDAAEWAVIHRHPAEGHRMLGALGEWLGPWALVVLEHHERWDGQGYPQRLRGEEISTGARLVAVADCYDVMTSVRSYRPQPRTPGGARAELVRCSGTQFDPAMVRRFLSISTRHLWWLLGPVAWVVQVPVVGRAAISGLRHPMPKVAELGRLGITGLAVTLTMPGLVGAPPDPAGPDAAEAAALQAPVAAAVPATAAPTDRSDAGTGRADAASSHPTVDAVPARTPHPPTGPAGGSTAGAGIPPPAPAHPPESARPLTADPPGPPGPSRPSGPVDIDRPDAASADRPGPPAGPPPGVASPVDPRPSAVAPPSPGGKDHRGHGYGHAKERGKGHARHDKDGDGKDDKIGPP